MSINLNQEIHKCKLCKEKFIQMSEECMEILAILKETEINGEMDAKVKCDLEQISRRFEDYAKLFDAYKMRFEEEEIIDCVYAPPNLM